MKTSDLTGQYDVAIVLGLRFGGRWGLRRDLKRRLDKAAELYKTGQVKRIIVSGRWTIWFDWLGIKPPVTEAALMRRYLCKQGVERGDVILEAHSKDTVGNVYYAKLFLRHHSNIRRILVICALQQEARAAFLFHTFFGPQYVIEFYPIVARHYHNRAGKSEALLIAEERILLAGVREGHEEDLHHRLYQRPYYRKQATAVERHILRHKLG